MFTMGVVFFRRESWSCSWKLHPQPLLLNKALSGWSVIKRAASMLGVAKTAPKRHSPNSPVVLLQFLPTLNHHRHHHRSVPRTGQQRWDVERGRQHWMGPTVWGRDGGSAAVTAGCGDSRRVMPFDVWRIGMCC